MICPECKKDTPDDLSFCMYCGSDIHKKRNNFEEKNNSLEGDSDFNTICILEVPIAKTGDIFLIFFLIAYFIGFIIQLLLILRAGYLMDFFGNMLPLFLLYLVIGSALSFISGCLIAFILNLIFYLIGGYKIVIRK
ncbi:MAG: hypothetical protein ACP5Q5_11150 [Brevinematia bacterium]